MSDQSKYKVIVLCAKGRFQHYLLNCLNEQHQLVGAVYVEQSGRQSLSERVLHFSQYLNPVTFFRHLMAKIRLPKYEKLTEERLQNLYPELAQWQHAPIDIPTISVANVNDPAALAFIKQKGADVICVNGTNLVREPLLSYAASLPFGIINLHTGLSPYSRGGNCNLFMFLEGQPQFVGGTIHYIDKGIDSGDIIHTFRPTIEMGDPFELIEARVFIEGMKKISSIVSSVANQQAQRVKQWESGKLFLLRTGYKYSLYHRLLVNQKLQKGLINEYLTRKEEFDRDVTLIEGDH